MPDDYEHYAQYKPLTDWRPEGAGSETPAEPGEPPAEPVEQPAGLVVRLEESAPKETVPPLVRRIVERLTKPGANPTGLIVALGSGAGILFGIALAANSWHPAKVEPKNLGAITSNAVGLTGHLFTKWDDKLEYRMTLEPSDPSQRLGFSVAVVDPPRPLSINLQLKDSYGFVVCSKNIVLRYDPVIAANRAVPTPQAGKTDANSAPPAPAVQGADMGTLQAQEAEREKGTDVFQNALGPDGQIDSINAQGELPCPQKAYDSTVSWGFTPDFPTLAEQESMMKHLPGLQPFVTDPESAPHRKAKANAPEAVPLFYIEGDDEIVWSDASGATVETRGGKTFLIDKSSGPGNGPGWRVFPASIHYKCDQTAACLLTRADSAYPVHARLKR